MTKSSDFVLLGDRPLCSIEEQLMELMILNKGGSICYIASPCMKYPAIITVQPSIVFVDAADCFDIVHQIETAIQSKKTSLQQQLWKTYIHNVQICTGSEDVERPSIDDKSTSFFKTKSAFILSR